MAKIHRPSRFYIVVDLLILLLSFYVVLDWFPLTTGKPFEKYSWPTFFYVIVWLIVSYLIGRYRPLNKQKYFNLTLKLLYVCEISFIIFALLIHYFFKIYSGYVLLTITVGAFVVNYIALSIYFAYKFAVDYNDVAITPIEDRVDSQVKPANKLDVGSYNQLCYTIRLYSSKTTLEFLKKQVDLASGNTFVFISNELENLKMLPNYQYSTMIQLERLNDMRGVDRKLSVINEKLADDGLFICCFESKSTKKNQILRKHIKGVNYIFYGFYFLFKRVMPKVFLTKRLYYFITGGKKRIFSKTEVLGRLYCSGFKVILDKKVDQLTYVVAQRVKQPETFKKRIYGPLIRLRRVGKDGEPFVVYKMRTMHPYSEYLQSYIFEKNSLKEGGKFNKDIRITTSGGFLRKYWLDELPMIINLLKGEMKLVGVRPLSNHYYNLYHKELQEKRNKFKPGLLPPFYADMPKTLDEIQDSEMRYLIECEKKGTFLTDIKYIYLIFKNIFFKRARSS
jgi:lipopolysaccharide/colanic/teichoic acid biosynthesis glycosyltransferase